MPPPPTPPTPKNILVIGTGAIGAFYASRLSTVANTRVSAVCRSNYNAIRQNGIRVRSPIFGETVFRPAETFASVQEAAAARRVVVKGKGGGNGSSSSRWDYLIVTTKVVGGDSSALVEGLVDQRHRDDGDDVNGKKSSIVVFQNGLGIEEPFRRRKFH
jgi:2-dehydropantoate 2-reductase